MKHQINTIREALEFFECGSYSTSKALTALTALSELERMAVEPVAWKHDCAALLANDVELWIDNCPHCGRPRAAPPAQQPQEEHLTITWDEQQARILAVTMQDEEGRILKVLAEAPARQPQARPDFTDEWTGYLKDGETPFERFMRERKDLNALTKLYQRALEENERLKAQQPQAEAVPPANCRQRLAREGKLHPRSSCAECGPLSPKWQECNLALALEGANK